MGDVDRLRARREAVRTAVPTRYGEALNRYLGAVGHAVPEPAAPPARRPAGVVLVGVDETPTSYTAVDHAAIEAELHGWDLHLLHVGPAVDGLIERLTARVRACSPDVAVTARTEPGHAGTRLLCDAHDADLLVVGHRHRAAGTAFGLSVADRVAAYHTGPAMIVRVPGRPARPALAELPVVVGVDGAPTTAAAVAFAVAEARVRGCPLIQLHVSRDGPDPAGRTADVAGVPVTHRQVTAEPPAALVEASGRAAAVVVGRRGPGGFAGSMLGSVSRALVQHAHCPVFLVG